MALRLARRWLVFLALVAVSRFSLGQGFYGTPRDDVPKTANQIPAVDLPAPTALKLPGVVDEIVIGGSGKYLIAHLKTQQQLAIIDVAEMKMVKLLPAMAEQVIFAANAEKLFVILPEQAVIQRWSLTTFERELAVPLTEGNEAGSLTTGFAATDAPLLVGGKERSGKVQFLDAKTLQRREYKQVGHFREFECGQRSLIRASANGKLFVSTRTGSSPAGYFSLVLQGDNYEVFYEHKDPGLLNPSADGERLYSAEGVFGPKLKKLGNLERMQLNNMYLPSMTGEFYQRVTYKGRSWNDDGGGAQLEVFLTGDERPLASYKIDIPPTPPRNIQSKLRLDRRVLLYPDAKKLVVLDKSDETLSFYEVDPVKLLEQSDRKYLFVTSRPPLSADPGKAYEYQVAYRAKSPKVTVELVSGPANMTVTPQGKVTWTAPAAAAGYSDVILLLKDDNNQELFHSFRVVVGENSSKPLLDDSVASLPPGDAPPTKPLTIGPEALQLTPAKFAGASTQIKLPSSTEKFELAGGGRYLLAHLKALRKIAVVDLCAAKIAGYIPVDDDSVLFAGGAAHVVTVLNDKQIVVRWSLPELKRELALPLSTRMRAIALGSASAGPLVMLAEGDRFGRDSGGDVLYDLTTLQPLPLPQETRNQAVNMREGQHARVSADGSLIIISGSLWPLIFNVDGKRIRLSQAASSGGDRVNWGIPNADGSAIYSYGRRFSSQMRALDQGRGNMSSQQWLIPSAHDRFYLSVMAPRSHSSDNTKKATSVYLEGESRPLANLPAELNLFPGGDASDYQQQLSLNYDKRIAFVPGAQVIVSLDAAQEALVLTRFDLDSSLEASGLDYLYVTSRPPKLLDPGQKLEYQVTVKSRRGGVKMRLESGPPGMTIDAAGKLTWTVPDDTADKPAAPPEPTNGAIAKAMPAQPDFTGRMSLKPKEPEQTVVLAIGDQSGQEIFHSFTVAIRLPEPPPKVVEAPKPQTEVSTKAGVEDLLKQSLADKARKAAEVKTQVSPFSNPANPFEQPVRQRSPFADRIGELHTWTDVESGRTVEAKFLGLTDGNVRASLKDGREIPIPLTRLSRSDLIWLLECIKSPVPPAASASPAASAPK